MESNKKKIEILGEEFFYKICCDCDAHANEQWWTIFYKEIELKKRKKFLIFGKWITYEEPKVLFTVYENIESINYTKNEMKAILEKKVELLNREEQIKKGEII